MAKKSKEARVQVILECTEHKESGMPGTSRYIAVKYAGSFGVEEIQPHFEKSYST